MTRYEFCYLGVDRRPCFGILYDNNILSACERFLFREVVASELQLTTNGNYFVRGWDAETISVKEDVEKPSDTFSLGEQKEEVAPPPPPDLGGINLGAVLS